MNHTLLCHNVLTRTTQWKLDWKQIGRWGEGDMGFIELFDDVI